MTETTKPDYRAVAQGNHKIGYRGAMIRDYDGPDEKIVARCKHRHPTTGEARSCISGAWFHARNLDGITVTTRSGQTLSAEDIEGLADKAEEGFDLKDWKPR